MGSRLINSDSWVPSIKEPKNNDSGLSRVMFILQQRGALQMATILSKKLRTQQAPRILSDNVWTWQTRRNFPPSSTESETSSILLAGEALASLYLIGELDDKDLLQDLEYESVDQMDELIVLLIQDFLRRNLECSIPIIPPETLATLITAAGEAKLRGWDSGPIIRLWYESNMPEELLIPSFLRWSTHPKGDPMRQAARDYVMKSFFSFAGRIILNSVPETHKLNDWISKCSHLKETMFKLQGGIGEE